MWKPRPGLSPFRIRGSTSFGDYRKHSKCRRRPKWTTYRAPARFLFRVQNIQLVQFRAPALSARYNMAVRSTRSLRTMYLTCHHDLEQ